MTPDQRFARWVRVALLAFALLFVYFIVADAFMPMTPQARVMREVTRVAPEVGGRVIDVPVANNAAVEAGDVLFRLDPEPYRIAVREAELAVEQAGRDNAHLDASLAAARARLAAARAQAEELAAERQRMEALVSRQGVSRQQVDMAVAEAQTAQASVAAAEAEVHALEVQRGERGVDNLALRRARNGLDLARLNLERTTILAGRAGRVSNLQLSVGDVVAAGVPLLAHVGESYEVIADYREKSLRHTGPDAPAWVTFDALPGRVFAARVVSQDAGVREGQIAADGQLADIPATDRWVRDAQRLRVHLALEEQPNALLASGARATVQLAPNEGVLARLFAHIQIRLMSWLHYVY